MPRGDKSSYSSKQKRQARHIEQSEKRRGRSSKTAGRIAWATVNKQSGGAKGRHKKGRSGRSSRTRSRQARGGSRRRSSHSRS
jgi:hypothetical protein